MEQRLKSVRLGGSSWLDYCRRETATGFLSFKQKVFKRDGWRCNHCGFVASSYMQVLNWDGNYYNNVMSNMYTVCPLCFWSHFIEHSNASGVNRGILIYMPELSQSDINGIMHAVFCSIAGATTQETSAEDMYKTLKLRAKSMESLFGEGRSDPTVFGQMVINSMNSDKRLYEKALENIRWLPSMTGFVNEVKQWSTDAAVSN